ncbi:response regulator [Stenomitos frigidus]|uniref:Response regulator n=1 Tax=Stenomitos frigidus ULC18 TaxID=2107698 RepID=A0A2T1EBF1_9CYAN|nr:response regulator [Stenomitos frigidus]PSB30060.1 response regulator [Stenomitos frigidus ULC18]
MSNQVYQLLAVDDIPDNLFLLQTILEAEGFVVDVATNGTTALNKIKASPPDLVLLDVMMPGMTGYEVTQRIRQDRSLPPMPILLITAQDEANSMRGLALGANDFISKPIDVNELLSRIRAHLQPKRTEESDRVQSAVFS